MLIESHLVNVSADIKMLSLAKHTTEYCGALASVNLKNGISLEKPVFYLHPCACGSPRLLVVLKMANHGRTTIPPMSWE